MSVAYYLRTEQELSDFSPEQVDGKALALASDYLERKVCKPQKLAGLLEFLGDDPRDILGEDFFDDDTPEENLAEQWFDAAQGLPTISAMIAHLQSHADVVQHQSIVLEELHEIQHVLNMCQARGIRFHLAMDL